MDAHDSFCCPFSKIQGQVQICVKTCPIFVVYLDDHCQVQELNDDLPGSYGMEKIFLCGSVHPLKIRAAFYT
jgi:hypothetical protein